MSTVCSGLSVPIFWVITVVGKCGEGEGWVGLGVDIDKVFLNLLLGRERVLSSLWKMRCHVSLGNTIQ